MRKIALITIAAFVIFLTTGCHEDNITTEEEIITSQGISGSARLDSTGDGIYDVPIANKRIVLRDSSDSDSLCIYLETYTDQEGNYSFDGLALFDIDCSMSIHFGDLYITHPENNFYDFSWEDTTPDGDVGEGYSDINDNIWPAIDVHLEIGEYDDGNDFRGRYYSNRASGMVVDNQAAPIENMRVRFRSLSSPFSSKETLTDENGYYEFLSLHPGEYQIELQTSFDILTAEDASPDPDGISNGTDVIDLVIGEDEFDDDNNFVTE